jgi:type I restriction enzyme S subunit
MSSQVAHMRCRHLYTELDNRAGVDSELPLLAVSIHKGVVPREAVSDREPRANEFSRYKICDSGDLVINRMRAFQGAVGMSPVRGMVSPDYAVLRVRPPHSARFLHYLFRSRWFVGQMSSRLRGIGTAEQGNVRTPRINIEDLGDIVTQVPAPDEQRRIAGFLDRETARTEAVIQQKRLLLKRLSERRRSVIFYGVTGFLSPGSASHDPGFPWARRVRDPWPAVKIKHVAMLGTGHTPSRSHPEYWQNCTIPWITTGEIQYVRDDRVEVITETREKISEVGLANSSAELHSSGSVVLCRTASAGYSAIMGGDMATSQDFATWTCSDRLLPRYLLMCLRAMRPDLQGRIAFGSTHKTIYMPDIEELKIPLPSLPEQEEILSKIDSYLPMIDELTERLGGQLTLLSERRQALITATVTGLTPIPSRRA